MRNSSRVRVWTGATSRCLVASRRLYASTHSHSAQASATTLLEKDEHGNNRNVANHAAPSSLPWSSFAPPQRYRRRSSDPQTVREKGDFRRDYKYAKHRPLPDAPWRQLKAKTYLDDAERLYGRKEMWHTVEDAVLRERLVAILQDYLRDTLAAARLEAKEARKYHHLCFIAAKEYRAHVSAGAFGLADGMQAWARDVLRGRRSSASSLQATANSGGADVAADALHTSAELPFADSPAAKDDGLATSPAASSDESTLFEFREERRRRGEQAVLAHTAAMADLPDADVLHTPQSAFPFLRRRAVEDESTLDPSLVDWTAKYFPEDDKRTFAEPPKLRSTHAKGSHGGSAAADGNEGPSHGGQNERNVGFGNTHRGDGGAAGDSSALSATTASRHVGSVHARHRLQRTLRDHESRHRATFDAEGVYYRVRRQSEAEERAPKPQAVKASDLEPAGRRREVVKVPWSVASKAAQQGYSSETLRAKERLIRLTRGEDPETIP
jgi:hypothetical protein